MSEFPWWGVVALKLAATGCAIALSLVWASRHGLRRLWTVGLSATAATCLAALLFPRIELYAYHCGGLCGEGWDLSPFGIALSWAGTAAVLSPPAVRARRALQWVLGCLTATLFLASGLIRWIA